jgi:signal transduction protein with GAF and PtsI domain
MQNKELPFFQLFRDVCKVINSSLDLKVVLMLITENIVKLLKVKACTIFLLDKNLNKLNVSASHGLSESYLVPERKVAFLPVSQATDAHSFNYCRSK